MFQGVNLRRSFSDEAISGAFNPSSDSSGESVSVHVILWFLFVLNEILWSVFVGHFVSQLVFLARFGRR
jgi:hypothetical protein